jgi:hypothetical protein
LKRKYGFTNQQTKQDSTENKGWKEEETCFGTIRRGPNGEVILPPGVFDKIDKNVKSLSESKSNKIF